MKKIFLGISAVIFLLGVSLLYVSLKNTPQAGAAPTSFGENWNIKEYRVYNIPAKAPGRLAGYVTLGPSKWEIQSTTGVQYCEKLTADDWQNTINGKFANENDDLNLTNFGLNAQPYLNKAQLGFGGNQDWVGNSGSYSFVGCTYGAGECISPVFGSSMPTTWTLSGVTETTTCP